MLIKSSSYTKELGITGFKVILRHCQIAADERVLAWLVAEIGAAWQRPTMHSARTPNWPTAILNVGPQTLVTSCGWGNANKWRYGLSRNDERQPLTCLPPSPNFIFINDLLIDGGPPGSTGGPAN